MYDLNSQTVILGEDLIHCVLCLDFFSHLTKDPRFLGVVGIMSSGSGGEWQPQMAAELQIAVQTDRCVL